MNFTLESLEQFQLATSQFTAADGRTGGVAVSMVTKSGTNLFHGSGFLYARDKALTAKDYFTEQDGRDEVPFSRQQFGGSLGGPIVRNRMFFFGAIEYVNEQTQRACAGPAVQRVGAARGRDERREAPGRARQSEASAFRRRRRRTSRCTR